MVRDFECETERSQRVTLCSKKSSCCRARSARSSAISRYGSFALRRLRASILHDASFGSLWRSRRLIRGTALQICERAQLLAPQ